MQKNYQIWHHRRCVIEKQNDCSKEKDFLVKVFEEEDKNYHAWSYRIWLVQHFDLYDGEIEYIDEMIQDNPFNNSAWSYRYFLIAKTKEFGISTVEDEINYAFNIIDNSKLDNEAPWVYIRGFLAKSKKEAESSLTTNAKRILITEFPFLKEKCQKMLEENQEAKSGYRFINTLLLDYLTAEGDKEECIKICDSLMTKYDPIRENYWLFRKQQYENM